MNEIGLLVIKATALAVIPLVAYLIFLRRLADAALPYRLEMAELGEKLLAGDLSPARRVQTNFYLDNAFSGWVTLAGAILFPFVILRMLVTRDQPLIENSDDHRMTTLFSFSVFAANPLFGTILMVELFLAALVMVVFVGTPAIMRALAALVRLESALPSYRRLPAFG